MGGTVTLHQKHTLVCVWGATVCIDIVPMCSHLFRCALYCAEYAVLVVPPSYTYHINGRLEGEQMKGSRFSLHRKIRIHSSKTSVLETRKTQRAREKNNDERGYNEIMYKPKGDQEKYGKVVRTDCDTEDV